MRPALKHVVLFKKDHDHVQTNVTLLQQEFRAAAKLQGIRVREKGIYRNLPGQPEAIEHFFMGIPMSEYINILIEREASKTTQRQQGGAA